MWEIIIWIVYNLSKINLFLNIFTIVIINYLSKNESILFKIKVIPFVLDLRKLLIHHSNYFIKEWYSSKPK